MSDITFPKTMRHPHHVAAINTVVVSGDPSMPGAAKPQQGRPERFPPVDVMTAGQEAYYLSRGYVVAGAAQPGKADFAEWPKMLTHPEHVPATPATMDAKLNDAGKLVEFAVPGVLEKMPHVQVNNITEQRRWEAKGYCAAAEANPDAYAASFAAPFDPSFEIKQYPMMVDGVVVQDPDGPGSFQEYPKWIGGEAGEAVSSVAEEVAARVRLGLPAMEPRAAAPKPVQAVSDEGRVMQHDPALNSLLARAAKLGIDVQEAWGPDEVMDAMIAASVPATQAAPTIKNKGGRPRKNPLPTPPAD